MEYDSASSDHLAVQKPVRHLNQFELARRWRISERTLERWRWLKQGPSYLRLGGRIAYRVEDIEAFEVAGHHVIDVKPVPPVVRS